MTIARGQRLGKSSERARGVSDGRSAPAAASRRHTRDLQRKYNLENLELHQLPIERVREIGRSFDLVVCTGVLHHLPDLDYGLRALRDVLRPSGAMRLMVYARYGRAGIYMMQEYCRLLKIDASVTDLRSLRATLEALPANHPRSVHDAAPNKLPAKDQRDSG